MDEKASVNPENAKKAVREVLSGRGKKAHFATELLAQLRRSGVGKDEMDQALNDLQAEGLVIARDNFCADPHLANVDLRVIALVDDAEGANAHVAALREIDLAWNNWLGEYLANHRCG